MADGNVLIDAGPLVALLDRRDQYHAWATAQFRRMRGSLMTCDAVLSEAFFLVQMVAKGNETLCEFLERDVVVPNFDLRTELPCVLELIRRYRDVPMSLADACLVRMAELHDHSKVFTLDAHFRAYRKNSRQLIPLIAPWD